MSETKGGLYVSGFQTNPARQRLTHYATHFIDLQRSVRLFLTHIRRWHIRNYRYAIRLIKTVGEENQIVERMPVSLKKSPSASEEDKMAGCGIKIILGIVTLVGLGWACLYLIFSPSLWKTVIGRARTPDGIELCVGRAHDGDISYQYFARVRGAGEKQKEWTYVGWSLDPIDDVETAVTPDSKFAAVQFRCADGRVLVIYDAELDELWWISDDKGPSTLKFFRAWRQLHTVNQKLSEPP